MDLEQITQRIQWLDEERRKDKSSLASLEDRQNNSSGTMQTLLQQIKELSADVTRLKTHTSRIDSIEDGLLRQKKEAKQLVDTLDKEIQRRMEELEKVRRVEMGSIEASLSEARKAASSLAEVKRSLQSRVDEETRVVHAVEEMRSRIESMRKSEEEFTRLYRLLEDGRRQDGKRITDVQGELSALRKRMDDMRTQMEVNSADLRKIESRISETEVGDVDRRKRQTKFMEEQSLLQVERERTWKEWVTRFDKLSEQTVEIETALQSLDISRYSAEQIQQKTEELAQKVERRIAEMGEVQRLSDERFRQEWATSRTDDQKRWTNYTLQQQEQRDQITRQSEKLVEWLFSVEDGLQDVKDTVQIINDLTEKRLQGLLAQMRESVSLFERSLGKPAM